MKGSINYTLGMYAIILLLLVSCSKSSSNMTGNNPPPANNGNNNDTGEAVSETRLTISKSIDLAAPRAVLYADTVYTSATLGLSLFRPLPSGFEDKILSFRLPKGYMLVVAENSDGTGESETYVAVNGPINADLPDRLKNKISYIRYIPIDNPDKKGSAFTSLQTVDSMASDWFYNWGLGATSSAQQQYVPMTWGKGACSNENVSVLAQKSGITHLLSFNEPDNADQSNIPNIDTAVARYKIMQKTGLRLGSPVTTQDQVMGDGRWLTRFMATAATQKLRIDYIAVHWYDWGNQTNNQATDSLTAEAVFNRFVTYMGKVHAAYPGKPLWVTEFNANVNRTSVTIHKYFMKLASEWLNNTDYVERYSYFFPNPIPAVNGDGSLTDAGAYWKSMPSTKSFNGNIVSADTKLN